MVNCSYCSEDELLPFTCSYCQKKFCRNHHLPEKHNCTGLTKEKWKAKKNFSKNSRNRVSRETDSQGYKKIYEIPGVSEAIYGGSKSKKSGASEHFNVDDKLIAASILILIVVLGIISRFF